MRRQLLVLLALMPAAAVSAQNPPTPGYFADVQLLTMSAWYSNSSQPASRYVVGYDDAVGARLRYWNFNHSLGQAGAFQNRLAFDVFDFEATTHMRYDSSDVLLAGGLRYGRIGHTLEFNPTFPTFTGKETGDLVGPTIAAEGRTRMVGSFSVVYGGRLSMLEGDWHGHFDYNTVDGQVIPNTKNERFFVPEGFTGVEYQRKHLFTRLTVEGQSWQGDRWANFHDYGVTGYGLDVGWTF